MPEQPITLETLQHENAALRQRVADLEQAQAAHRQSETEYVALFEATPNAVVLIDRETQHIYAANPAASQLTGYSHAELLALKNTDLSDDAAATQASMAAHETLIPERYIRRKDGSRCPVEITAKALTWRGRPGLIAILRDITDRKQAEAALRDSEALFAAIFQTSPIGINILQLSDNRARMINDAFLNIIGYTRTEALSRTAAEMNLAINPTVQSQWLAALNAGQSINNQELAFRHGSGEIRQALVSAHLIEHHGERLIMVMATDITARKQMEEALRASEARFRGFIEQSTDALVLFDEEGRVCEWNASAERATGLTREAVQGQRFAALIPQLASTPAQIEQAAALDQQVRDATRTGQAPFFNQLVEVPMRAASGEGRCVEQVLFPIPTERGYQIGAILRDVTARKQTEAALRESQSLYHSLVEISPLCICRKDLTGHFTFANRRYLEETQIALTDLLGKTDLDLHPPELAVKYRRDDQAVIDTDQVQELVEERTLLNGDSIVVQSIKTPTHDSAGRVNGVQISFWDVTARQRDEQVLERRATQLAVINYIGRQIAMALSVDDVLERAANLIHTQLGLHHVGIFIFAADRTELILHSRAGDYTHLFAADHRLKIDQGIVGWVARHGQRLLANDVQVEPRYVNLYGDALPTRAELAVPIMIGGEVRGVLDVQSPQVNAFDLNDVLMKETLADQIAIALENARLYEAAQREIAERQQAERALRDLNTTLELRVATRTAEWQAANLRLTELDRLKDEFLSRISHELRTPLTSIKIYLELLPTAKPDKQSKYLETLTREADRLHALIEDVLIFSQLGHYAEPTEHNQIDLNDWLLGRLTTWRKLTHQHDLTLQLNLSPELPRAQADADLVIQVVTRLMTNAVNYTPTGTITLSTASHSEGSQRWATVSVTDTGPGITPEDLPHIFERFYRGRAAADYKTPGTGLGLAIGREIIEHMGGQLTVSTQLGVGSTFTIWLPAV